MIMSKMTAETIGEVASDIIRAILKCMDTGTPNARQIGIVLVTRIDSHTFSVGALASTKNGVSFGIETTADLIANYLLSRAWLDGTIDILLRYLNNQGSKIGDGAGWLPNAKEYGRRLIAFANGIKAKAQIDGTAVKPGTDDRGDAAYLDGERSNLLRKLRRAEKMAIEGTVSRKAILDVIEKLEDKIENQYDPKLDDVYQGAIDTLFGILGA